MPSYPDETDVDVTPTDYWKAVTDKSLPQMDRVVAYAYAELRDAAESVARAMSRLAVEAERDAGKWMELAASPETAGVPTVFSGPYADQVDKALRQFQLKEAALKGVLMAQRCLARD